MSSLDGIYNRQQLNCFPCVLLNGNRIFEAGEQFLQLTGYDKDDIINKDISYLCRNLLRININLEEVWQSPKTFFIFTKDLEPREVEICVHEAGNEKAVIFKENSHSIINKGFEYFQQHIKYNILGAAIFHADNFILLKANQTFLSFLDEPYNRPENSVGRSLHEICTGFTGSSSNIEYQHVIDTGEPLSRKEYCYEGFNRGITYWDVTVIPVYENGIIKYIVETASNVTEKVLNQKRLEEQNKLICEQNQKLEAIIENMSDALVIVDENRSIIKVNKALRDLFPLDESNNVSDGYNLVKYYTIDGKELSLEDIPVSRVLKGEKISNDRHVVSYNGKEHFFDISGSPIFDEKKNLMYGVVTGRDVTEKVKYEQMIKKQQDLLLKAEKAEKEALEKAMKMKDEFLLTITHEFKTPLTVINAAVQAITSMYGSQLSDSVKKHIQRIRMNSFRQLRLVNSLLDITKCNSGHIKIQKQNMDIIHLTRAITESVRVFAAQKVVNLEFSTEVTAKVSNIVTIQTEEYGMKLPDESVSLALVINVIHEVDERRLFL